MPKDRGCAGPGHADTVRQSASKCDIDARFRRRYHFSGRRAVGDEMPYTSGRGLMRSVARIGLPLVALSALTVSITLDRQSTRLNSSHYCASRMPFSALKLTNVLIT